MTRGRVILPFLVVSLAGVGLPARPAAAPAAVSAVSLSRAPRLSLGAFAPDGTTALVSPAEAGTTALPISPRS